MTKKQKVMTYISNNPRQPMTKVAADCNVSMSTVHNARMELGLVRTRTPIKTKKQIAIDYLIEHPEMPVNQVAKNCGVSRRTVQDAQRDLKPTPSTPSPSPSPQHRTLDKSVSDLDLLENLKEAVSLAGNYKQLQQILHSVSKAGGVEHVQKQIENYINLKKIFLTTLEESK